jgi:phage terminase large subunit GpA-like protein
MHKELGHHAFELLKKTPNLTVWEWAEGNIKLSERSSELSGRYRTTLVPYVREPLEFYRDRNGKSMTLCFGAQTTKTTILMIGQAWVLIHAPTPALWVMPSIRMVGSFVDGRWFPMVDSCPLLVDQKLNDRFLWKKEEQHFRHMTVNWVGSNSASNLSSRSIGLLTMDETDKFKMRTEREAGAVDNAELRTTTFAYAKKIKSSTPTSIHGEIWKNFLNGDQRYYFMPCPHCNKPITFKWGQVKWDGDAKNKEGVWDLPRVAETARYHCQECDQVIENNHKSTMLRQGSWVPTNPNAQPGELSYHLNAMYAPWQTTSFAQLAVRWCKTSGNLSARHAFINSVLAEVWDDERGLDNEPLATEEYTVQVRSDDDRVPIMSIDVQENHFWAEVRLWAPNSESWLLDYQKIETYEELPEIQKKYQVHPNHVIIDINRYTAKVAKWCVENDWRGAWGSDKKDFVHILPNGQKIRRVFSPMQTRDPHLGTVYASDSNPRARFVFWSNEALKDQIAVWRSESPTRWHIHSSVTPAYHRQINAEIKVTKRLGNTGRTVYYWKQMRKDNHALDCECMNLLGAIAGGVIKERPEERDQTAQGDLGLE